MADEIATILERHELFKRLSSIEREKLASIARLQRFEPRTVLYRQDEPANGMYVLVDGSVELSRVNRHGRTFVLAALSAGDTFGELALLDAGPRAVSAETVTESSLLFLETGGFNALIDGRERVALETLRLLSTEASGRLRELNRRIVDTMSEPTALASERPVRRSRPDRDFFHGLMAGLYAPKRDES